MRVPAHLLSIAKELGLRSWVSSKAFPIDDYCETVEHLQETFAGHLKIEVDQVDDALLIPGISRLLDLEQALAAYVVDEAQKSIKDEEAWANYCEAAAWTVLQRYYLLKSNGKWPK